LTSLKLLDIWKETTQYIVSNDNDKGHSMTGNYHRLIFSVILIFCMPSVCNANPIRMPIAPFILIPLFLIMEGVIIVFLAKSSEPYRIRFIIIWFFITLLTLAGLYTGLAFISMHIHQENTIAHIVSLILGECIVALVEGLIIWCLLRWRFLARNLSTPPSLYRAIVYSVFANVASLGGSIISFLIPS
jgi:hypothetical protein